MFFRSWESVLRVAMSAAVVYILVVGALRVIGARALAKMSAYDLIVTVALGSLVASIPLSTAITVSDGIAAIVVFLGLQELTRQLQARYRLAHHLVRERPHVVVWDGEFIEDRLEEIQSSHDEVRAAIRQAGFLSIQQVQAVVLENDGAWSVMQREQSPDLSALEGLDVPGHGLIEHGDGQNPRTAATHGRRHSRQASDI